MDLLDGWFSIQKIHLTSKRMRYLFAIKSFRNLFRIHWRPLEVPFFFWFNFPSRLRFGAINNKFALFKLGLWNCTLRENFLITELDIRIHTIIKSVDFPANLFKTTSCFAVALPIRLWGRLYNFWLIIASPNCKGCQRNQICRNT